MVVGGVGGLLVSLVLLLLLNLINPIPDSKKVAELVKVHGFCNMICL